jgi:hypothetical protein
LTKPLEERGPCRDDGDDADCDHGDNNDEAVPTMALPLAVEADGRRRSESRSMPTARSRSARASVKSPMTRM